MMNVIDIIVILLIILSGYAGFKDGVLKSLVKFVGTIVVYVIAFMLKDEVGIILCKIFPFFEFDGLVTLNILVYQLIAFILIASVLFGVYNLVMKLTGVLQKIVDISIILTIPSKVLGFIVGMLEGYIIMFIVVVILSVPLGDTDIFKNAKLTDKMINNSPILTESLGGIIDSLTDVFVITSKIENNGIDKNSQINLDIMDTFLKYDVITKEDALDLIKMKKLESVTGIESFVENYEKA